MSVKWHRDLIFKGDNGKDPSDVVDYTIDFKPMLQADTISTVTATGTNITIDSSSASGNVVTVWVSAGTDGCIAEVKLTIVTSNATPRTFERTFKIEVRNQ